MATLNAEETEGGGGKDFRALRPHARGPYLILIKSQVVRHDVVFGGSVAAVALDAVDVEGEGVAQDVAHGQGEVEAVLLAEAVEHVEDRAAGRLVGLQEHEVGVGPAGAQRGPLDVGGVEQQARSRLDAAERGERRESESVSPDARTL